MQYVDNFKKAFHINEFKKVEFTAKRDKQEDGSIEFRDGKLCSLDIVEEADYEVIHMYSGNG